MHSSRCLCGGTGKSMWSGWLNAIRMDASASPENGNVVEWTRRLDRSILKAMDHAETEGAKPEPTERRNDARRFGNSRIIGPRSEVEQVYSYTGTQSNVETGLYYYRHRMSQGDRR